MTSIVLKRGIVVKSYEEPATLAPDAIELKLEVLRIAGKIKQVRSLPSEEMAVEALTYVQRLRREMERCRKSEKEKPLNQCREIDGLAKDFDERLFEEETRIKRELGEYAEIKRQEALAEEKIRQAEIAKIQAAQREEEEKIARAAKAQADLEAEAERLRLVAENAKTQKARDAAEKDRLAAQAKANEEAVKLAEAARAAQAKDDEVRASMPIVAPKATGAATKFVFKYEVVDINDLFAHAPQVVELTEKKSAVNALINGMSMAAGGEVPKIPGLRIWREADVNTRSR